MNAHDILAWLRGHAGDKAHLCLDTRQLQAGDVFFACPGLTADGRAYIAGAVAKGAAAIIAHDDGNEAAIAQAQRDAGTLPFLAVRGLVTELGGIAHAWYGAPSDALRVVAVTGTNGKTSCVQWLAAALNGEGIPCGTIGTLGVRGPDGLNMGGQLTTPDVLTMHRSLAALRDAGSQMVALEASSIGIEQGRLSHVHIDTAAFTNLTRDHLDYHQTEENYRQAKFALFGWPGLRRAVINADDETGAQWLARLLSVEVTAYSTNAIDEASPQAVTAHNIHGAPDGLVFTLRMASGSAQVFTHLVGEHNISNLLLVAGVLQDLGWSVSRIARALASLHPVAGRLQLVPNPRPGVMVVVDYAHTPDALARALVALRPLAKARGGRLVCVFGCGGNRDRGKRPMMGSVASAQADKVILTNDNPRDETPRAIIGEIAAGMSGQPRIEPDRALAILAAIWEADAADVVLLAGKGHEAYQEMAGVRQPFDDREWARLALTWHEGLSISTDTRSIQAGELFVAIRGDRYDGHAYLDAAARAGAAAAIVDRADPDLDLPQIALGDTRQALIRMATAWRRLFGLPVIAVTGSNGKTTTKEMIAAILAVAFGEAGSLATLGNLNNDIGVPLSVLRLRNEHRAAVLELGMNHPGEIAVLTTIAQPTVALVNNAQREHQEFMVSVEAVAKENGSVLAGLPDDGTAVFPAADAYASLWREMSKGRRVLGFGMGAECDVHADRIHAEKAGTRFDLRTPEGGAAVVLRAPGLHNLHNALAAAASAMAAGVGLDSIARGLQAFNPVKGRMQPRETLSGFQLIDDTYNANPDSVRAAVDVLAELAGCKVLVLGDMAEVGENGPAMHAEVGRYARDRGIDTLFTLGVASQDAATAFGEGARSFGTVEDLALALAQCLPAHVLVKGSRSMRMERVIEELEKQHRIAEGAGHAS